MKVCHATNLIIRSHLTMFFIMYKSEILVKVIHVNSKKVHLLHLKRNGCSIRHSSKFFPSTYFLKSIISFANISKKIV